MIRMQLEPMAQVVQLEADHASRSLRVWHTAEVGEVSAALRALDLGTEWRETQEPEPGYFRQENRQRQVLWWVLGINAFFFVFEMGAGWWAGSMGLVADSLDMLADALVYGMSLLVVGGAVAHKKKVARYSGFLQMLLASLGLAEVIRRFFEPVALPLFQWMIGVSVLALLANVVCLWLINRVKGREAHMRASAIFTSNDIVVNSGVILAGVLVYLWQSRWPDLIIGCVVFALVMRGALRILKLAR